LGQIETLLLFIFERYPTMIENDKIRIERRLMMSELFSKIKEVTEIAAISGHEAPVRKYLREKITPHVDEVITDGLGGIFGVKHSKATDAPQADR